MKIKTALKILGCSVKPLHDGMFMYNQMFLISKEEVIKLAQQKRKEVSYVKQSK